VADDIRALSAELARDPSSLRYVDLAEALRRKGHAQEALQVAMHGLGRHPDHADGYDALARIHTDRGELDQARAAWERALAIAPEHAGALKGIGFLFYRQGEVRKAREALEHALAADPNDDQARRALAMVRGEPPPPPLPITERTTAEMRRPSGRLTPEDVPQLRATAGSIPAPRTSVGGTPVSGPRASTAPATPSPVPAGVAERPPVFAGLEGATADILLLEHHGLVLAGGLRAPDGVDVSELAAAALAGVSGEAERTAGYLKLGAWTTIVAEADGANVVLAPVEGGAVLMVRRERSTPVGLAIRIAERARETARRWLEGQGL
jgi:tetratricopeptide (TPR) repeat protein